MKFMFVVCGAGDLEENIDRAFNFYFKQDLNNFLNENSKRSQK